MNLIHRFVRHAARRSPATLRERLEEEWLADLHERRGMLSRLRFAAGCWWATHVITRDFARGQIVAAGASGPSGALAFAEVARSWRPRRPGAMLLIIAFHGLVILAFTSSLMTKFHPQEATPTTVTLINDDPVKEPEPQRWQTQLFSPGFSAEDSTVKVNYPKDDPVEGTDGEGNEVKGPESKGATTTPPVQRVQGGPGAGFPASEDFYPSVARQMNEQGVAAVNVCVDAKGRLVSDPALAQSTGHARLDEGALRLAKAGSGHYRPTRENGQPVESCYAFRVRFTIR